MHKLSRGFAVESQNQTKANNQWWASLALLYYNTKLKGQYWYCIGVLANMCNTGDYAILSNTEIFVCNTEANMMQYQENSMQ